MNVFSPPLFSFSLSGCKDTKPFLFRQKKFDFFSFTLYSLFFPTLLSLVCSLSFGLQRYELFSHSSKFFLNFFSRLILFFYPLSRSGCKGTNSFPTNPNPCLIFFSASFLHFALSSGFLSLGLQRYILFSPFS
jgi:hypothetical protein